MPLYEYGCGACGEVSEINHRMADPAPVDCPACGAPQLSKLISAAGFRLKGEGWYETDFKSGGKRNLAGEAGSGDAKPTGEAKAETKAEAKTESKAAPKADSKPAASSTAAGGT
ncbi:FmdB family zinc ribbon protein [Panacagrimonas sp.]|uniref:FmdB family zinc ribbon protein n=1 Tax=Panacagrimonas sp. TaxID=2480088 RepID=UPI003B51D196